MPTVNQLTRTANFDTIINVLPTKGIMRMTVRH